MQKKMSLAAFGAGQGGPLEFVPTETPINADGEDFYGYDRRSIFVQFFLIIDDVIKLHIWNHSFYFFQYIMPLLQVIALSFWPYYSDIWMIPPGEKGYSFGYFVRCFGCVFFFSPPDNGFKFNLTSFIIIASAYGIIFVSLVICFLYYYFSSRSLKKVVPIFSFLIQILNYIFFMPSASIFSTTFKTLEQRDSLHIFAFIYLLLTYVVSAAYIVFSSSLINYLTNPNRSFFASFDGKHFYTCLIFYSIQFLLRGISAYLPIWFFYFVMIQEFVLLGYLTFDLFSFPYVNFYTNSAVAGLYVMSVSSNIFVLLKLDPVFRFFLPLITFMIAFIIFSIIFLIIKKRILSVLNCEGLNNDQYREEFLSNFKISSQTVAYQYLHLGFMFHSMPIINGNFSFFIAQKMSDVNIWLTVTSIISFFPSERTNFSFCVNSLKQLYSRKFIDKLRILHFIKLEQQRYLTSTAEINRRLMILNAATNDAVTLTKRFWLDVSKNENRLALGTLNNIAGAVIDAKNLWNTNLNLFPNEHRFASEYSKFLVECVGKFEKGMFWFIKATHLEKGIHHGIDELFKAFVCSDPSFLRDKVVDKFGNLCHEGNTSVITMRHETTHLDKIEEEVENGMIEKLMHERFLWPNLRNHLSRATSHYRPKYLSLFTALKYFSYVIILILLVVLNVMYTRFFDLFNHSHRLIENLNDLRVGLGNLEGSLLLQWGNQTGYAFSDYYYNTSNSTLESHNPSINPMDFDESLVKWINNAQVRYVDLFKQMSETAIYGENIAELSEQIINEDIERYFCFPGSGSGSDFYLKEFMTSTKAAMVSILWSVQSLMYSDFESMTDNTLFCELNLLFPEMPPAFNKVSSNFSSFVIGANETAQKNGKILISVFLVVAIVFWVPLIIIPQFIVQKESQKVFAALKSVDKAAANIASQKLSLIDESNDGDYAVSQQHMYSYSSIILMWRLLYSFLVLIILIFAGVSYNTLKNACNNLERFVLLNHYGSARHGQCAELFALVVYKLIGKNQVMNYMNFTHLENLFLKYTDELVANSNMFIHGEDNNGMSKYSDAITKAYIDDNCETVSENAEYFECMSFQRAISTFIISAKSLILDEVPGNGLSTEKFVNFFHIATCEIDELNTQSRNLTTNLIRSTQRVSLSVTISLLTLSIIFVIACIIIDIVFNNKLIRLLKTALLLIRHLPPPAVVESPQILSILLVQTDDFDETQSNANEVIFNSISSPTILVGEGNIIEAVNKSFQLTYGFQTEQIVGHHLNNFIPQPTSEEPDMSPEEQGAFHLYEKMNLIQLGEINDESFSYLTKCTSNEDEAMLVNVSVYTVKNKIDQIRGFVIIVEDKRRAIDAEEQLIEIKKNTELLMNQLIPRNFASIAEEKGSTFSFKIPSSFVIAVHINDIESVLERNWSDYDAIISALESDSYRNPPFFFLKTIYDVVIFIGGLFEEKEMKELASISIDFCISMMKSLNTRLKSASVAKRFSIAISCGGPLYAGLIHEKNPIFDVSGSLLFETAKIAVGTLNEVIVLSKEARGYFQDDSLSFKEGSVIDGIQTYVNIAMY
ncbi:hypothetical protein TRFO_32138 [Tritrichomonas foetus]|uniref:PAS domain-containing protein n=1 Tax=Tritrichomonas foetus TaxID=1144522 RepID=A0A1J4JRC0_9EUKA|nr:hypothetical protein TRFO_32138 [Tritrichomonas foetus]|eukprot:OHT00976.1 hypothetical protein TRFO_32138 [Tritrichomonas foetus]